MNPVRLSRPATVGLIGPPAAGKSEVGRALARALGRRFRDTDAMVERKKGMGVSSIFEAEGENAFRKLESEAVLQAVETPGAVIACGGGVVLDPSNVKALRGSGMVVYLRPSVKVASLRVGSGKGRPLLGGGDPESALSRLIEEREPLYLRAADYVVDADGGVAEVTQGVLEVLGKPPKAGPPKASAKSMHQ